MKWGMNYFRETMASGHGQGKKLGFIAHEMGHVMGLAHSDFSNVLMRADIAYNSSSTSRAQTNDLGGINYLYK